MAGGGLRRATGGPEDPGPRRAAAAGPGEPWPLPRPPEVREVGWLTGGAGGGVPRGAGVPGTRRPTALTRFLGELSCAD